MADPVPTWLKLYMTMGRSLKESERMATVGLKSSVVLSLLKELEEGG